MAVKDTGAATLADTGSGLTTLVELPDPDITTPLLHMEVIWLTILMGLAVVAEPGTDTDAYALSCARGELDLTVATGATVLAAA